MPEHKVPKTFRLRPELVRALDFYCADRNRTMTDTVEKALVQFFGGRQGSEKYTNGLQEILDDND